jgi:hypothetical protein
MLRRTRFSKKYVLKRFHNPNQTKTDTTTGLKTCDGIKIKYLTNAGTTPHHQPNPGKGFVT